MSMIRPIASLIAAGLLVACGTDDDAEPATAGPPDAQSTQHSDNESAQPPESPRNAPTRSAPTSSAVPEHLDFTMDTVDGGTFAGANLVGTDAVLYFWAPWCPICRREMPTVVDAAEQHGADVAFLGVASSGGLDEMKDFVSDTDSAGFAHLADENGRIWATYGVTYQHTYAFLNDDGSYELVTGPLSADELAAHIDGLSGG